MANVRTRPAARGAGFSERAATLRHVAVRRPERQDRAQRTDLVTRAGTIVGGLAVVLIVGFVLRGGLPDGRPALTGLTVGVENATPEQVTALAAAALEDRTRVGGLGYRFEVVQTSTIVARVGGPRIPIPDPLTRGTIGLADRYFLNSIIEHGVVRPDGFWSQMQVGPPEGAKPDWSGSPILYEALVRGAERWRADGEGWYQADALPGIGLDPETAALLPGLLRKATAATDLPIGDIKIDPGAARTLEAGARAADIPGVIASKGAAFTELTDKLAYGFDALGRLVSVTATALNLNMTEFDLVIETRITIAYDAVPDLPEPQPVFKPGPAKTEGSN